LETYYNKIFFFSVKIKVDKFLKGALFLKIVRNEELLPC